MIPHPLTTGGYGYVEIGGERHIVYRPESGVLAAVNGDPESLDDGQKIFYAEKTVASDGAIVDGDNPDLGEAIVPSAFGTVEDGDLVLIFSIPDRDEKLAVPRSAVSVECVRVSSLTTTDGRYPGKIQDYDVEAKTWSDRTGGDCWVVGKNGSALQLKRYEDVKSRGILAADSKPVYAVWEGGSSTGGGSGCSREIGWLLDKSSLTYSDAEADPPVLPRAFALIVSEGLGRCDCVSARGDTAAGRYFAALDAGNDDPVSSLAEEPGDFKFRLLYDSGLDKWVGVGNIQTCCGCSTVTLAIDPTKLDLDDVPTFILTISEGCESEASATYTMRVECGNDRWLQLVGVDSEACDPVPSSPECVNLFRIRLVCVPCELDNMGCTECSEGSGPAAYKIEMGTGEVLYVLADSENACGCVWAGGCLNNLAELTVADTTITLTYNGNTYVYNTEDTFPGCANPPTCWEAHTLTGSGGSAVITPIFCDQFTVPEALLCTAGTPDLHVTVITGKTQTKTAPFSDTGYSASGFIFGDETGCNPPAEEYSMDVSCEADSCGGYTMSASELAAPTGGTVLGSFSFTSHSTRPVYITFSGTIECCTTCDGAPGDLVTLPYTGYVTEWGAELPYWCVDGACTQSMEQPAGTNVDGPFANSSDCATICACQESEVMALADFDASARPMMMMGMAAPPPAAKKVPDKAKGNRAIKKYLYPCEYRGVDPAAEKATCAEGCQKGKDVVSLFECQHFGELVSLSLKTTQGHRTCRDCGVRQSPSSIA